MLISEQKLWTDVVAFDTFKSLVEPLTIEGEAHYYWSPTLDVPFFETKFTKPLVILCIRDLLGDPGITGKFPWVDNIVSMCRINPTTKFIVFVSIEHVVSEFPTMHNLRIVHMGGDWLNEIEKYQSLQVVTNKNFNTDAHVINLNRNPRLHRVAVSSYLYGSNIPAVITYLHSPTLAASGLLDIVPWNFDSVPQVHRDKFLNGFDILKSRNVAQDDYEVYADTKGHSDTIGNFEKRLRSRYENSFVEVITETTFVGNAFMFNEKILQCMVAYNFPILMASMGVVNFLRQIGFDMFDDIVNHSYDTVSDPVQRIVTAINSNHRLLTDAAYAKQKWQESRNRFEGNMGVMKNQLVPWLTRRTVAEFDEALNWTNSSPEVVDL